MRGVEELVRLAAADPGGDEAVAVAVEYLDRSGDPKVAAAMRAILEAWGRRLYLTSGAHRHSRGSESHEARIQESAAWVWEKLSEWRPNPDRNGSGSPAAYLNSIGHRMPPDLTTSTGGIADLEPKARRVQAALRVALERAEREGRRPGLEEIREETRQVLTEHIRTLNPHLDEQQVKERMRKDGHNAWLRKIEDLVDQTGEMQEETAQEGVYGPRDERDVLTCELIEEIAEHDSLRERRQRLCAPHLQYLVRTWKS